MMYYEYKSVQIAAKLLGGQTGDPGLLNHDLVDVLIDAEKMVNNLNGIMRSEQVVATIISCWKMIHSDQLPYNP